MKNGKNASNIEARFKKIKSSTCNIITCANSDIMKTLEMETLFKLYETVNMPILLHNSETWIMTKTDKQSLEKIDMWSLKKMISLPITTPSPAIKYETGTLYIQVKIDIKQMMFLWKILQKPSTSWQYQTLHELDRYNIGWAKQIRVTLSEYDIDQNWSEIASKPKNQWKSDVYQAGEKRNKDLIIANCYKDKGRSQVKTKTRLIIDDLEQTDYERGKNCIVQQLNKLEAKTLIMAKYGMLDCGKNFKMLYKTSQCDICDTLDDEQHRIFICPKWSGNTVLTPNNNCEFSDIVSQNLQRVKQVIKIVLEKWDLTNGKNIMKCQSV